MLYVAEAAVVEFQLSLTGDICEFCFKSVVLDKINPLSSISNNPMQA